MEPIKSVLKEELENSLRLKKLYEKELRKLPSGVLVCKNIKGHKYYYLVKREGGKVRYYYKGKLSKKEIAKWNQIKNLRKKYKKLLKVVNNQIAFLRKSLRNGKKAG
jgi:hypothetical protein